MPAHPSVAQTAATRKFQRPTSWGANLTREKISRELTAEQWQVIDDLLQAVKARGITLEGITNAHFSQISQKMSTQKRPKNVLIFLQLIFCLFL